MNKAPCGLVLALFLAGCAGPQLMPTPNIYAEARRPVFVNVPPEFQKPSVDVYFATDRTRTDEEGEPVAYGPRRSSSLAFGRCEMRIGDEELDWAGLVHDSTAPEREHDLSLSLGETQELVRFPETPLPLVATANGAAEDPAELAEETKAGAAMQDILAARLALTPRKDVYVFIHGYDNDFKAAVFMMGNLWHFLGREGVPCIYTWAAGHGGFFGYFADRESGEFTIFHLKQFLRLLIATPGVERIHLLAHSRGTDVTTTALRELVIESRGRGEDPKKSLKIADLVLLAPDLDYEVVRQRVTAERVQLAVGRVTLYVSAGDKAIGLADWLFSGVRRLGQLRPWDLTPKQRASMKAVPGMSMIDAQVSSGFWGHSYFRDNPSASSDLMLLLRENLSPGRENGRPLVPTDAGTWELHEGYPNVAEDE